MLFEIRIYNLLLKKLSVFLFCIPCCIKSQDAILEYSNNFSTFKGARSYSNIDIDQNTRTLFYKRRENIVIQKFDTLLTNVISAEEIPLPLPTQKFHDEGLIKIKENLFWLYSIWDKSLKKEQLYSYSYDKNKKAFSTNSVRLVETEKLEQKDKFHYFSFKKNSQLLVTYLKTPDKKSGHDVVGLNLFDSTLTRIFSTEVQMPYKADEMKMLSFLVTAKNTIVILSAVKANNSVDGKAENENKKAEDYRVISITVTNNTPHTEIIKLDLNKKYISYPIITEHIKNKLQISGYYSNIESEWKSNGTFLLNITQNNDSYLQAGQPVFTEFPIEMLKAYEEYYTQIEYNTSEKNGNAEAKNLQLHEVVTSNDGSLLFIGEERYVTYFANDKVPHYDNILLLKADSSGKMLWCKKIPKHQLYRRAAKGHVSFINTSDLSYFHHRKDNMDYFFYLDNIANIEVKEHQTPHVHNGGKGGYLFCTVIDQNGAITKKAMIDTKDFFEILCPTRFLSLSESKIISVIDKDDYNSSVLKILVK